jgi:hypothetical protein
VGCGMTGYNPCPDYWENILGTLVLELEPKPKDKLAEQLSNDSAVKLINKIIFQVRASNIVTTMKFSSRLLFIYLGIEGFNNLLKVFFKVFTPSLFANIEANNFYKFLLKYKNIRLLEETLSIDLCILNYSIYRTTQRLLLFKNPSLLMKTLLEYKLPRANEHIPFVLEIGQNGVHARALES